MNFKATYLYEMKFFKKLIKLSNEKLCTNLKA